MCFRALEGKIYSSGLGEGEAEPKVSENALLSALEVPGGGWAVVDAQPESRDWSCRPARPGGTPALLPFGPGWMDLMASFLPSHDVHQDECKLGNAPYCTGFCSSHHTDKPGFLVTSEQWRAGGSQSPANGM